MATLKEFLKADRFATCAGVELLEIKPGYARACMEVTDRHLNGGGVCQGGALFTSTNTTDKIQTHYFAPQFSLHWLKQQFDWYFTTGTG